MRPAAKTRSISGEIPFAPSDTLHHPSLLHFETPLTGEAISRIASSQSGSSQSMSTSSSSTFSSNIDSIASDTVTLVSVTDYGIPIISVGHISEETDLEALSVELGKYSDMTLCELSVPGIAPSAYQGSHQIVYPEDLPEASRITAKSHSRTTEQGQTDQRPTLREVLSLGTRNRSGMYCKSSSHSDEASAAAKTGPKHGLARSFSGLSSAGSADMAVLVDTERGRHRRAVKARPTLAQTLSSLQGLLSEEEGLRLLALNGERPSPQPRQTERCSSRSRSVLPAALSSGEDHMQPVESSMAASSEDTPCVACRVHGLQRSTSISPPAPSKISAVLVKDDTSERKLSRRLSQPKEVRFMEGS
ncbi:hypothetical protein P389DRAFT_196536 [Cystobasidium minutum MCA 4210]|uniref:uncharacterized protein n=1 Tax=Cystobasidium minutum MCA 4210 TaxID=1397322 RepID=UPI0034CF495E|eukprot:jgi/Rhomi1/196536/gm1.4750_g